MIQSRLRRKRQVCRRVMETGCHRHFPGRNAPGNPALRETAGWFQIMPLQNPISRGFAGVLLKMASESEGLHFFPYLHRSSVALPKKNRTAVATASTRVETSRTSKDFVAQQTFHASPLTDCILDVYPKMNTSRKGGPPFAKGWTDEANRTAKGQRMDLVLNTVFQSKEGR